MAELDATNQPTPEAQGIDLRQYWRVLVRRRWPILAVFVGVVALNAVYTFRLPKVYAASATLVIEMAAPKVLGNGAVQDVADSSSPSFWYSKEYYETQFNVLRSRVVAELVAHKLLTGREDQLLGLDQVDSPEAREAGIKALEQLRTQMRARPDPGSLMLGRIGVEAVKDSRITRLTSDDRDPLMAAAIVNAFANAYMEYNLSSKSVTTEEATENLQTRLPELDQRVQQSTQDLVEYRKAKDIGSSFEDKQKLIAERTMRINQELVTIRIRKATLKARNDAIASLDKSPDDVAKAAQVPESNQDVVRQLQLRLIDARTECEQLEERLLAEHPKLKDCKVKLANASRAYQTEVATILARARAEYTNVVQTEHNLLEELNQAKADAEVLAAAEPEYQKRKRAYESNLRLYDLAIKSLKETGLSGTTRMNNVSMLDAAKPVLSPAKPNVRNNLAIGVIAALLLSVLFAFFLDFVDNTITRQEEIEERLGLSFLGILPAFSDKGVSHSDTHVFEAPKSAAAECCRAIRTNLLFMSPERVLKSLLVTSAGPRDGKTTTAASLAITMAESGNKVLLVDADLRRPRVHTAFKVPNGAGLSSLVLGEGTLEGLVKSSGVPNLSLLTCGPIPPNPAELLHTKAFQALLQQMAEKFDRVIIDSPPVGAVADAVVLSTLVDGTVVVIRAGSTSRDLARRAVRALKDVKSRIFGAILNDIDLEDRQAGGYYYYSKYGYYYGEPEGKDAPKAERA